MCRHIRVRAGQRRQPATLRHRDLGEQLRSRTRFKVVINVLLVVDLDRNLVEFGHCLGVSDVVLAFFCRLLVSTFVFEDAPEVALFAFVNGVVVLRFFDCCSGSPRVGVEVLEVFFN